MKKEELLNNVEFTDVAIIGMDGKFPDAKSINEFWNNIKKGKESIKLFSEEEVRQAGVSEKLLKNPKYIKAGASIERIEEFDADFFNFTPLEARLTDPQQRLFLECCWNALEDAGCSPEKYKGNIGVYGSMTMSSYLLNNLAKSKEVSLEGINYPVLIGNDKDFLATRVSYKLNLEGPSLTVQTACSSSLVAIHLACQSLINRECDVALVGGVSITLPQKGGYLYKEGGIMSTDGHCRAFDNSAEGTVKGNGVGVIVLKSLEDAIREDDNIIAVIKSTAINNDGSNKIGYTAPSIKGQSTVIAEAIDLADIDPESISYVETHGTGTSLGDPIEIEALKKAFYTTNEKKGYCAIGSVKPNIGHLDAAAGVTGVIKAAMCLNKNTIPPSINYEIPNQEIDFENSPFYVNQELQEKEEEDRLEYAGVSAFGLGGTNAHAILQKAPEFEREGNILPYNLFLISAKKEETVNKICTNLGEVLSKTEDIDLSNIAYTLSTGRDDFNYRYFSVCKDKEGLIESLAKEEKVISKESENYSANQKCSFLFSADENDGFVTELYQYLPYLRYIIDSIVKLVSKKLNFNFNSDFFLDLNEEDVGDVISFEARKVISTFIRKCSIAKMLQECGIKVDSIYSQGGIGEYVASCISGVLTLEDTLELLIGVINDDQRLLNDIKFRDPEITLITGRDRKIEDISYWKEILEIRDNEMEENIKKNLSDNKILIEIGSKDVLEKISFKKDRLVVALLKEENKGAEIAKLLNLFGLLWSRGLKLDWENLYNGLAKKRISLPTYPFNKQKFWVEPTSQQVNTVVVEHNNQLNELDKEVVEQKVINIWEEFLGEEDIKANDNYFDLGGESLIAVEIVSELQNLFNMELTLNEFMDLQTPQVIAEYIIEKLNTKANNKLIGKQVITKLQDGKSSVPIFLVHPAGGSVFCYHQLKNYLSNDFTIYGIQFPEDRIKEIESLGLKELAAEYIKEMKKIRPVGPYLIGGYSFGGNAAYEMALQLEEAGEEVFDIFMMDSLPPASYYEDNTSRENSIKAFPLVVDMYINHNLNSDFQALTDKYYRGNDFGKMFDAMKEDSFFTMNVRKKDMEKFFEIWDHNHRILGDSTVDDKFSGNIVMFNAVDKGVEFKKLLELLNISDLSKKEWGNYTRGEIKIIDVPGDHFTLFGKEFNLKELAKKLNSKLTSLAKEKNI